MRYLLWFAKVVVVMSMCLITKVLLSFVISDIIEGFEIITGGEEVDVCMDHSDSREDNRI